MSGFELVPIDSNPQVSGGWELAPIEPERPSKLRQVAMNNPLTAVGETALNLASQGVAMPLAGLAGLATEGAHAVGLTDKTGADVVQSVADAMTYQPRGEMGQAATQAVMAPFEKLHEAATWVGDKTQDATGSPGAATVAHTIIEGVLPMAAVPGVRATRGTFNSVTARALLNHHRDPSPATLQRILKVSPEEAQQYFDAWQAGKSGDQINGATTQKVQGGIQRLDSDTAALPQPEESGISALRRQGDNDLQAVDAELQELSGGRRPEAGAGNVAGAIGREWELQPGELPVAGTEIPGRQSANLSQRDFLSREPEYRGDRAAAGDVSEHPAESLGTSGDGFTRSTGETNAAPRRAATDYLEQQDAEHSGMGARGRYQAGDAQESSLSSRDSRGQGFDTGTAESLGRAERILKEQGGIAGFIDHYNRHVRDGQTVESFTRNADGSHTLRVSDGKAARTVDIPADQLPRYLDVLRDPAKVAEIEARNAGDVVLGERVRDIDDARLQRMHGMEILSAAARSRLAREIKRREVTKAAVAKETTPLAMRVDDAAHRAATSPLNSKPQPTKAQIEAGTYAKGHLNLHGLDISIENPKGSIRKGTDASGRQWETKLENHYGYFKRSQARDGDHVDAFIGDMPDSPRAFIIDQIDPKSGKYDEPKVILGAIDEADAKRIYHANYESGWKGMGAISEMPVEQFREWVKSSEAMKPVALPKIAGKHVTEFDAAALQRITESKTYGESAKAKARAEIERRTASADFSAESAPATQSMAAGVQNGTWNPGANYAPFVDQVKAPVADAISVADLPVPKRREAIIKQFADAIGTTVYEGRVAGKNRLGFFRNGVEEVRIKNAGDIEVTAHEVAHLIDSRVPELRKAWQADKDLAAELKSISYDKNNVREGFAESMRLFLTQPETLEARSPKVAAWLEDFAGNHSYGPALLKAREQMTGWFGQDALNRARSKIGDPGKFGNSPTGQYLREWFGRQREQWRQFAIDDLHGIYQMERDLTGKINPLGSYETARLSRASASIADGAVRFGYPVKNPDGSFKYAGKGLEEILQPVAKNVDDTLLYFVGRSANELMGQGREHLFTKGEIDAMLRLKTPERAKAFEEYQTWNKGILDFAEAQGVINPETRRLWQQRTQYLPFHRVEQPGGIKGKPGDWSGVQQLTGGTTNLKDILGNMVGNAAMLIDKAVKNEARLRVVDMADGIQGAGKFMVKIPPGERPVKVGGNQVLEAMFKKYGIAVDGEAPAFFEFMIHGQPPAGNNVVAVLRRGKPEWYEVGDPILYRSLKAIDRPITQEVVKWLALPKRVGQITITATPDFWTANIARDTIQGGIMSRAGFRPVIDSLKGMSSRMTSDPAYRDYIANGGGLSSFWLDETHLRSKLKRFYQDKGIDYRTVLDAPDKLLGFIETLGDAFEMSTRMGEYDRAIAAGENPRHAAYLGREVSTDFAMRGDSKALGFMYDTVMFLKPAVLSWDRLYRGLAHDENRGAIAAKAGVLALSSAALYLLNRDDPRYKDLTDWDRDGNWHFFIGDQHYRWPKIWEIGSIASLAERSVERVMQEDPEGLAKDFARILKATFNVNLMPQLAAPLVEQATNRNNFTTAPLETPGMENIQPFLRAKPGTSETMKALGMATRDNPEWAQINPVRAEALLRGYFNTWAMYGLMLTDQAAFGDKLPEKRTDELPVVRRFYSQEPAKHTKYETEFYDLLSEAKRLRGTLRELDDLGLRSYADAKEQSPLAGEAKPLDRAQKNLAGINNDMQAVRRNDGLTSREKRERLDALTAERNALLKAAVTESKAAQKENVK